MFILFLLCLGVASAIPIYITASISYWEKYVFMFEKLVYAGSDPESNMTESLVTREQHSEHFGLLGTPDASS